MDLNVFIGWDSREVDGYEVCAWSLQRRSAERLKIIPLKRSELQASGLYDRTDPDASTEFSLTRFLVPHLSGYRGVSVYCDCDFLWLSDVTDLLKVLPQSCSVSCVQHNYVPTESVKMDGQRQTAYPRKNWSSLMVFNNSHEHCRRLTPDFVNKETASALHQFGWTDNSLLGSLPPVWNWLSGWAGNDLRETPRAVHFTLGGPWISGWAPARGDEMWLQAQRQMTTEG